MPKPEFVTVSVKVPKAIHSKFKARCALETMEVRVATVQAIEAWTERQETPYESSKSEVFKTEE